MASILVLNFFVAFFLTFRNISANRMKNRMYWDFPQYTYGHCFRRLNGTSQTGCSSNGAIGMLVMVDKEASVLSALNTDRGSDSIMLALPLELLLTNRTILDNILKQNTSRVSGLLLLHNSSRSSNSAAYSSDSACPNRELSLYGSNEACSTKRGGISWNPAALEELGLVMRDLPFPFVIVRGAKQLEQLSTCSKKYPAITGRSTTRVCAVEIHLRMAAVKDSVTCLRRQSLGQDRNLFQPQLYCADIGDYNIVATTANVPSNGSRDNNSVVALVTRLDSLSLFQDLSPAANSVISGLVTTLAAAEVLFKEDALRTAKTDVLLMLFQGESLDYIGSKRAVFDMKRKAFLDDTQLLGIELPHLKSLLEVNQVGKTDEHAQYYLHVDGLNANFSYTLLERFLAQQDPDINFVRASNATNAQLPPASAQSFLHERRDLPTVVITDHQGAFRNLYYHSVLDTELTDSPAKKLSQLATRLAQTVYYEATSTSANAPSTLTVSQKRVEQLLYCYLENSSCPLIQALVEDSKTLQLFKDSGSPLPSMVNAFSSNNFNVMKYFTLYLAGYLLGERLPNVSYANCKTQGSKPLAYWWAPGFLGSNDTELQQPFCYRHSVVQTLARSPATFFPNYDWSNSTPYPTWTESFWESPRVRLFLLPSRSWEMLVIFLGCLLTLITLVLTFIMNRQLSAIFPNRVSSDEALLTGAVDSVVNRAEM